MAIPMAAYDNTCAPENTDEHWVPKNIALGLVYTAACAWVATSPGTHAIHAVVMASWAAVWFGISAAATRRILDKRYFTKGCLLDLTEAEFGAKLASLLPTLALGLWALPSVMGLPPTQRVILTVVLAHVFTLIQVTVMNAVLYRSHIGAEAAGKLTPTDYAEVAYKVAFQSAEIAAAVCLCAPAVVHLMPALVAEVPPPAMDAAAQFLAALAISSLLSYWCHRLFHSERLSFLHDWHHSEASFADEVVPSMPLADFLVFVAIEVLVVLAMGMHLVPGALFAATLIFEHELLHWRSDVVHHTTLCYDFQVETAPGLLDGTFGTRAPSDLREAVLRGDIEKPMKGHKAAAPNVASSCVLP